MLEVGVNDGYAASLAALPERVRQALLTKANQLATVLQENIQQNLSGGVLNARSGALGRSITATIEEGPAIVTVHIAAAASVKYAAIQEFGGTIPPHEIVPNKAKALAFLIGSKQAFAARVDMPAVTLPERSYLRSSLAEMADEIRNELGEAMVEAML